LLRALAIDFSDNPDAPKGLQRVNNNYGRFTPGYGYPAQKGVFVADNPLAPQEDLGCGTSEDGHRLQVEGLVDWPWDRDGGECSSKAREFAERVARWSTGGNVQLTDGRWD
jgi:hypothetical protein